MTDDPANTTDNKVEASKNQVAGEVQTDDKSMHVKVYAPFKVYFDGEATSVSAVNDTGQFDVLPMHHNFMTLLNTGDIVVRTGSSEERIAITRGVMHVKADRVIVFLDV